MNFIRAKEAKSTKSVLDRDHYELIVICPDDGREVKSITARAVPPAVYPDQDRKASGACDVVLGWCLDIEEEAVLTVARIVCDCLRAGGIRRLGAGVGVLTCIDYRRSIGQWSTRWLPAIFGCILSESNSAEIVELSGCIVRSPVDRVSIMNVSPGVTRSK